ncbi:MAG: hypothetical protein GDA55_05860 [Cellvibrionales bacterium]|nr:hypothetical protein [Cellvibrionales bacterium]
MSDADNAGGAGDMNSSEVDATANGRADAIAATAIMVLAVLGVIHGVYTGGLPGFLHSIGLFI